MPYCGPSGSTQICRWANVAPGDEVEVEFDMPEGCKARESWMFIRGCLMLTMMTFSGSNKVHVCDMSYHCSRVPKQDGNEKQGLCKRLTKNSAFADFFWSIAFGICA